MPIHSDSWSFVYSHNKQSDAVTAIADANVKYIRPIDGISPVSIVKQTISDANHAGKGNSHPSYFRVGGESFEIGSQARDCTDHELAMALFMVFGAVASVNVITDHYTHTFTWQAIAASPESLYTTFMEQLGDGSTPGYKQKIVGAWLDQMTIDIPAARDSFCKLTWQGRARELAAAGAITVPAAVTPASFMLPAYTTLKFGTAAAPVISAKGISGSLTFNKNSQPKNRWGNSSGEELLLARADVGRQQVTGSLTLELDDVLRDHFKDDDTLEIILTLVSDEATPTAGVTKQCEITLPAVKIGSEGFAVEDQTLTYTVNFPEGAVLKALLQHLLLRVEDDVILDMDPPTEPDESGNYPLPLPGFTNYL
ncbi:hypothetical protein LCGC14_1689350 [marine sediment metagenome]|uniref:Uncharacterized protein n=1 Tax=marine sediment metagenome TaxID=412755 RepID=A0A0F9HLF0_9ZZZZ